MKRTALYTCILALVLAAAAFAGMAKHGYGAMEGTTTITPGEGGTVRVAVDVTGNIQHLGRSRVTLTGSAIPGPGGTFAPLPPSAGIVSAANGDTVTFILKWRSTQVEPGLHHVSGPFEITGGTGRFAGAAGDGLYEAMIDTETGETHATLEGRLLK